jgi:hypothetical protein
LGLGIPFLLAIIAGSVYYYKRVRGRKNRDDTYLTKRTGFDIPTTYSSGGYDNDEATTTFF